MFIDAVEFVVSVAFVTVVVVVELTVVLLVSMVLVVIVVVVVLDWPDANMCTVKAPYATAMTINEAMAIEPTKEATAFLFDLRFPNRPFMSEQYQVQPLSSLGIVASSLDSRLDLLCLP